MPLPSALGLVVIFFSNIRLQRRDVSTLMEESLKKTTKKNKKATFANNKGKSTYMGDDSLPLDQSPDSSIL